MTLNKASGKPITQTRLRLNFVYTVIFSIPKHGLCSPILSDVFFSIHTPWVLLWHDLHPNLDTTHDAVQTSVVSSITEVISHRRLMSRQVMWQFGDSFHLHNTVLHIASESNCHHILVSYPQLQIAPTPWTNIANHCFLILRSLFCISTYWQLHCNGFNHLIKFVAVYIDAVYILYGCYNHW